MNEKPILSQSEKETLKCLTGGEAPSLKELLSKDALVNVGLSSVDPEGNASSSPLCFCFDFCCFFFFIFFGLLEDVVMTNLVIL